MNHKIFWFKALHNADEWMRHWNYEMDKNPTIKPIDLRIPKTTRQEMTPYGIRA